MYKRLFLASVIAMTFSGEALAGPFKFKELDSSASSDQWNPAAPWKLPKGFKQSVISDETDLDIYDVGRDDWHDMNTVNETGRRKGHFLYRTHEVREAEEGGAVSVVDLKNNGESKVIAQDQNWTALDGIRWTPWETVLFAEEVTDGRVFELKLNKDLISGEVLQRDVVGRLSHEGIEIDQDGSLYLVDEFRGLTETRLERGNTCQAQAPCGGGIYKFVPNTYGDLSEGDLYVLQINGDNFEGLGQGSWVGPIDPFNAREAGTVAGGQSYQRPEDLEIIGDTLFVAITEGTRDASGDQNYDGRVIAINLDSLLVTDYVKPGLNAPVEIGRPGDANFQTGFDNPDNLAESPGGELVIVEDNVPSDIWFAQGKSSEADGVKLFASLADPSAEGTGVYFSPTDPKTLFVNIQHSAADDGDGTWALTKTSKHK